ncbi:MAG: SulP family inorganic anion transporter [Saprospiraceae bacterium]|nr:SulP family inorganic anion transporter [Saprospiraceae bacterium]
MFASDFYAGILVSILLVPQAIAYAYLAGMPPQYGLYAALIPILIYSFLGTSPHVAIGPVAVSAILVLAGISKLAAPFSETYIKLVILTGLCIGLVQVFIGLIRKGNLINLLSYPVISGFTSAASVIIISSQIKDILGIQTPKFESLPETAMYLGAHCDEIHVLTLIMALISFVFIFISKRINPNIPSRLILVGFGIFFSYFLNLNGSGVEIIGKVPSGLPSFKMYTLQMEDILAILPTVLLVTLIGIVESIGIAKALEYKNNFYQIDTNKELIALGFSKIGGSFFGALPSSASFSRSALLHQTKAKTTIASIITVVFVVLSLLYLTPLLFYLPKVILAVIIIYAVKNLFEFHLAKRFYHLHAIDFTVLIITFLATLIIGLELGVVVGFIVSFGILFLSKNPFLKEVLQLFTQKYQSDFHTEINEVDSTGKIYIKDQLHFGNAEYFKTLSYKMIKDNQHLKEVSIAFEYGSDCDSSGLKALQRITTLLQENKQHYTIEGINPNLQYRLESSHIKILC